MGMDFMRRGMKRRAEVMREAKEQWEQEVDDMIRRSQIDSEDEAAEHKIEEEAKHHSFWFGPAWPYSDSGLVLFI